ncbi:MAG TPA: hypothetical protein VEL47_00945 [Myxococcota bacterium]|nr:hypothetical protein [Myxococcota bacterium]
MIAKPASTVVLLRITTDWPHKILLVQRSKEAVFLPLAHVFPGGRVETSDHSFGQILVRDLENLERIKAGFIDRSLDLLAHLAAAMRETLEESDTSILYALEDKNRRHVSSEELRKMLSETSLPPGSSLAPQLNNIWPISWWVTPNSEIRRYNTLFFLAAIDDEICTDGLKDPVNNESIARLWVYPRQALDLHQQGTIFLPPPTRSIVERLAQTKSLKDFLAFVDQPIWPIHPQFARDDQGQRILVLPGDPLHETRQKSSMPLFTRYGFNDTPHPLRGDARCLKMQ